MASQSKTGRVIDWVKSLWPSDEPKVTVKKIEGTNIESFKYGDYHVEVSLYSDRVCSAIYLHGRLVLKTYRFASPEGAYISADTPEHIWPDYKVRAFVTKYSEKRLKEIIGKQE